MGRIFESKKAALTRDLERLQGSFLIRVVGQQSQPEEWRAIVQFLAKTLVKAPGQEVNVAGPIACGIRYHERFLAEVPHPMEVATILDPPFVFHPNIDPTTGAMCLGHLQAGFPLDFVVHLIWAGINLNMAVTGTLPGNVVNSAAANWVLANATRLPLSSRGLCEPPAPTDLVWGSAGG